MNIQNYYYLLRDRKFDELLAEFESDAWIDEPLSGKSEGPAGLLGSIESQADAISKWNFTPDRTSIITTEFSIVVEWSLGFDRGDLPVAMIAGLNEGRINSLRIYHSTWPLYGKHKHRAPVLPVDTTLKEPEVIKQYMQGIAKPDLELVLSLFTENGSLREPSGSAFLHEGAEGRKQFYEAALDGGGIPLQHCSATFDGKLFAVEYILEEWGSKIIPSQAGMAVYEIDQSHNKILAVRIYDDITPPFE